MSKLDFSIHSIQWPIYPWKFRCANRFSSGVIIPGRIACGLLALAAVVGAGVVEGVVVVGGCSVVVAEVEVELVRLQSFSAATSEFKTSGVCTSLVGCSTDTEFKTIGICSALAGCSTAKGRSNDNISLGAGILTDCTTGALACPTPRATTGLCFVFPRVFTTTRPGLALLANWAVFIAGT